MENLIKHMMTSIGCNTSRADYCNFHPENLALQPKSSEIVVTRSTYRWWISTMIHDMLSREHPLQQLHDIQNYCKRGHSTLGSQHWRMNCPLIGHLLQRFSTHDSWKNLSLNRYQIWERSLAHLVVPSSTDLTIWTQLSWFNWKPKCTTVCRHTYKRILIRFALSKMFRFLTSSLRCAITQNAVNFNCKKNKAKNSFATVQIIK